MASEWLSPIESHPFVYCCISVVRRSEERLLGMERARPLDAESSGIEC